MINLTMNSPSDLLELATTSTAVGLGLALVRVVVAYIPETYTALLQMVLDSWENYGGKNVALGFMGQLADVMQLIKTATAGDVAKLKEYIVGGADLQATDQVSEVVVRSCSGEGGIT